MSESHGHKPGGSELKHLSSAAVRALAAHALGAPVGQIIADNLGASNAIYFVAMADREQYVLRVSPIGQGDLVEQELWALNQARALGVPVPTVVFSDTTQSEYPAPYMIMRRLPGEPAFRATLTPQEQSRVLTRLGRHLRTIHSIPIAGFGYLESRDGVYVGRSASWWSYVWEEGISRQAKLPPTLLPPSLAASIKRSFEHIGAESALDRGVLLHGDYQFKNILVEDNQVTGILDFENLLVGDPVFDFCALHYWSNDPATALQSLLHGYGAFLPERTFLRRLYLYEILLAIEILWWEHHFQNQRGIRRALTRLKNIVATFDQL